MTTDGAPYTIHWIDSQRRRACALRLAVHLFPHISEANALRLARWICTGKADA